MKSVDYLSKRTMQQLAADDVNELFDFTLDEVLLRDIVDSSVFGTTNTSVLRFNSTNDSVTGDAMSVTHSATDGDSVLITKRGLYFVELVFSAAASDEVRLGLSADVAAGGLTGDPAMTVSGMLTVGGGLAPAASTTYHSLQSMLSVTEAQAEAGVTVRALGSDAAAGGIPNAAIGQNTDCFMRVTRMRDLVQ